MRYIKLAAFRFELPFWLRDTIHVSVSYQRYGKSQTLGILTTSHMGWKKEKTTQANLRMRCERVPKAYSFLQSIVDVGTKLKLQMNLLVCWSECPVCLSGSV